MEQIIAGRFETKAKADAAKLKKDDEASAKTRRDVQDQLAPVEKKNKPKEEEPEEAAPALGAKSPPKAAGGKANPDGDNLPNLDEYAHGYDPKAFDPNQNAIIPVSVGLQPFDGKQYLVYSYDRATIATDITKRIEAAARGAGAWGMKATGAGAGGCLYVVCAPTGRSRASGGSAGFAR